MIRTISETIHSVVLTRAAEPGEVEGSLSELNTSSWTRFCVQDSVYVHPITEAIYHAVDRRPRIDITPWIGALVADVCGSYVGSSSSWGTRDRELLARLADWSRSEERLQSELDEIEEIAMAVSDTLGDLVGEIVWTVHECASADPDAGAIAERVYRFFPYLDLAVRERHEASLGALIDSYYPSDLAVSRVLAASLAATRAEDDRRVHAAAHGDTPYVWRLTRRAERLRSLAERAEATALGGGLPMVVADYFDAISIADQVVTGDLKRTGHELTDRIREQGLAPIRHRSRVRAAAATLALRTAATPPLQGSHDWQDLDRWVVSTDPDAPMPLIEGHGYWCAAFAARLEIGYQPSLGGPGCTVRTPLCDFAARRQQAAGDAWTAALGEAAELLSTASKAAGEQPGGTLGELGYLMVMLHSAEAEAAECPTEHHDVLTSAAMDHVRRVALSPAAEELAVGQCLDEVLAICQRLLAVTCPVEGRGSLPPRPVRQLARLGVWS